MRLESIGDMGHFIAYVKGEMVDLIPVRCVRAVCACMCSVPQVKETN